MDGGEEGEFECEADVGVKSFALLHVRLRNEAMMVVWMMFMAGA